MIIASNHTPAAMYADGPRGENLHPTAKVRPYAKWIPE